MVFAAGRVEGKPIDIEKKGLPLYWIRVPYSYHSDNMEGHKPVQPFLKRECFMKKHKRIIYREYRWAEAAP